MATSRDYINNKFSRPQGFKLFSHSPQPTPSSSVFAYPQISQPQPGTNCILINDSGGEGTFESYLPLDAGGGLVSIMYTAFSVPDKFELIHDGIKVATSSMLSAVPSSNYGPFDNTIDIGREQYIGDVKGAIPPRISKYTADTGITQGLGSFQQILWWEYDSTYYSTNPEVMLRIVGSAGTTWRLANACHSLPQYPFISPSPTPTPSSTPSVTPSITPSVTPSITPSPSESSFILPPLPTPDYNTNCIIQPDSGGPGITFTDLPLDPDGGLVTIIYTAYGVVDKFELIHDDIKVATSSMSTVPGSNYGPFDPNDPPNTSGDQYIGVLKGSVPNRLAEYEADTGVTGQTLGSFQQIMWWQYDPAEYNTNTNVVLKVSGPTGTAWRVSNACHLPPNPTPSSTPTYVIPSWNISDIDDPFNFSV